MKQSFFYIAAFVLYVLILILLFTTGLFQASYWGGLLVAAICFAVGLCLGLGEAKLLGKENSYMVFLTTFGNMIVIGGMEDYLKQSISETRVYLFLMTSLPMTLSLMVASVIIERQLAQNIANN